MAKARGRQDSRQASKKKRDKRRLLRQQAEPSCPWQKLDVSGWTDNTPGPGSESMEVFYPKSDGLPSCIYENALPGEYYFSWYAHEHPDQEDELTAAIIIRHYIYDVLSPGCDPEARAGEKKAILKELEKLAKNGCITAACYLGYLYITGKTVRKNMAKAEQYLRLAAGKNHPLACYLLFRATEGAESEHYFAKSFEIGYPQALYKRNEDICTGRRMATGPELNMLAGWLAALACNGSFRSLQELLGLAGSYYGRELRPAYAPAMLSLLDRLVAENFVPAVEYKAQLCARGTLWPQDAEEARRLFRKAIASGSVTARSKYAFFLLQETLHEDMPLAEKKEQVRAAREMLEEEYSLGRGEHDVTAGLLGSVLVMSDDDADFSRGIQCFEENVSHSFFDMAQRSVSNILLWSDDKKRHRAAIRLLNAMVRKKNPDAIYIRGRLYMDGGLLGQQDTVKGVNMLLDLARTGRWEPCYLMTEIRLFGLYHVPADIDNATLIASYGSTQCASRQCAVLYNLIQVGELPDCTARQTDEAAIEQCISRMKDAEGDCYLSIATAMAWMDCDSPLSNHFRRKLSGRQISSEGLIPSLVDEIAAQCDSNMRRCNLGPLCYAAQALRKIGKTRHAALAAGIFAQKLHLGKSFSCDDIADQLQAFVDLVPASYLQYRLAYGSDKNDALRPLY